MILALRALLLCVFGLLVTEPTCAADEEALLGLWRFEGSSEGFPKQCQMGYFRFAEDGTVLSNDGSMMFTSAYRVAKQDGDLLLTFKYLSDNGHRNCQGLSAKYVRRHQGRKALLRFNEDGTRLYLFFGETDQTPHIELLKLK
jgi:hypothetical protein